MALASKDLVLLRLLRHCVRRAGAAALDPHGADSFERCRITSEHLFAMANAVVAERLDDREARRIRDAAVAALRAATRGAVDRLAVTVRLEATDAEGRVINQPLVSRLDDFITNTFPNGQISALSESPDRLMDQARTVRSGLATFDHTAPGMAAIDAAARNVDVAQARIAKEETELTQAYAHLDEARAAGERARARARAWAGFAVLRWPEAGIDLERMFPAVAESGRATEEDLDKAGVDPLEVDEPVAVESAPA